MNDHAAFFSFALDDTQLSVLALFWAGMMSWVADSPDETFVLNWIAHIIQYLQK